MTTTSSSDDNKLFEGARRFLFAELRLPDCVCPVLLTDCMVGTDAGTAVNVPLLQEVRTEMGIG